MRTAGSNAGLAAIITVRLFALMNPELTYTVSKYQTACGITDIMMHTLERYFCQNGDVALTDHLAEGLLRSVIDAGRIAIEKPGGL